MDVLLNNLADTATRPATDLPRQATSSVHDLPYTELHRIMTEAGLRAHHVPTLWKALYQQFDTKPASREDFLPPLRRWVTEAFGSNGRFHLDVPPVATEVASSDGLTHKYLLRLADGETIETVLMGYPGRFTACLSTQVGCAMGCVFCATGQSGFTRHLRPGEIVAQVLHHQRVLRDQQKAGLRNLVLMGMGEPLQNYDSVMTALDIITASPGLNLAASRITISTVGVVPGILRLAEEKRPYHLAVSLHGTNDAERSALVPAGRRWPMAELIDACRTYSTKLGRRIFFEWTVIAGVNDSPGQAAQLADLLRGIDAHINLIPLNPTGGFGGKTSSQDAVQAFQGRLLAAGYPCTIRQRRGIDVAAGCGQLRPE